MIDVRKLLLESVGDHEGSPAHQAILAAGPSVVPALLEALGDPSLRGDDSPGEGWVPLHAADLLGDLRAAEAIAPLLVAYGATDWNDHFKDCVLQALLKIGAPVLEPALRLFGEAREEPWREDLRELLGRLGEQGVQDDRAFQILSHPLPLNPGVWAARLAVYGDERAVPVLLAELDRRKALDPLDDLADPTFIDVANAVRDLGGALSPEHEKRIARTKERKQATAKAQHFESVRTPAVKPDKPGRNDPCWCGSTKKYKKCHLAEDEKRA